MKAEFVPGSRPGILKIKLTPESTVENYALDKWFKDYMDKGLSAELECVCFREPAHKKEESK